MSDLRTRALGIRWAQVVALVQAYEAGNITEEHLAAAVREKLNDRGSGGATKPDGGWLATDLEQAVQILLALAGTAYQKAGTGIPEEDLASAVRDLLHLTGGIAANTEAYATTTRSVYISGFRLVNGALVTVRFSNKLKAGTRLRVSADGGTTYTADKPIYYGTAALGENIVGAGTTVTMRYDGSYYRIIAMTPVYIAPGSITAEMLASGVLAGGGYFVHLTPSPGGGGAMLADRTASDIYTALSANPDLNFILVDGSGRQAYLTKKPANANDSAQFTLVSGGIQVTYTLPENADNTVMIEAESLISDSSGDDSGSGEAWPDASAAYQQRGLSADAFIAEIATVTAAATQFTFSDGTYRYYVEIYLASNVNRITTVRKLSASGVSKIEHFYNSVSCGGIEIDPVNYKITPFGLADPTRGTDAATKAYVDALTSSKILTMSKSTSTVNGETVVTYTYTGANFQFASLADLLALTSTGKMLWLINTTTGSAYRAVNSRGSSSTARLTFAGPTLEEDNEDLSVEAFILDGSMNITRKVLSASGNSGGIVPTPTAQQAGYILVGKADGTVEWKSLNSLLSAWSPSNPYGGN